MLAQVSWFSVECAKLLVVKKGVVVGDGIFEPVLEEHHCVPVVHLVGDEVAQESGGRAGWEQLWKAVVNQAGLSGHSLLYNLASERYQYTEPHTKHTARCAFLLVLCNTSKFQWQFQWPLLLRCVDGAQPLQNQAS
jgi:hypothetical protein